MRGKAVIEDGGKAVVEAEPWKRWEMFAAGDFSFYDQDQLRDLMQGFDTDTYAGSVGVEYRAKEWLNLGLAWSYLQSDTNVSGNLGNIDLEGNVVSGYATAFWRQYLGGPAVRLRSPSTTTSTATPGSAAGRTGTPAATATTSA